MDVKGYMEISRQKNANGITLILAVTILALTIKDSAKVNER